MKVCVRRQFGIGRATIRHNQYTVCRERVACLAVWLKWEKIIALKEIEGRKTFYLLKEDIGDCYCGYI